jgi:hypothetical protein
MRKEIIELDERFGNEYAGRYVFQEITWAKRSRIIQKHTKYHPITGQIASSDFVAIQAETILASLREQPATKPITLERLLAEENGVPVELGELFSKIANRLCGVSLEEQRFLSEPSEEGNPTQRSLNSGFAKNSAGHPHSSQGSRREQSSSSS